MKADSNVRNTATRLLLGCSAAALLLMLPATEFGALVGLTSHTLQEWNKRFAASGPAGLADRARGSGRGSRLPEVTRRAVLMLKEDNPEWGCQRISDVLARGKGLGASAGAVALVLHEAGYELEEVATRPHPEQVRSFERAAPRLAGGGRHPCDPARRGAATFQLRLFRAVLLFHWHACQVSPLRQGIGLGRQSPPTFLQRQLPVDRSRSLGHRKLSDPGEESGRGRRRRPGVGGS